MTLTQGPWEIDTSEKHYPPCIRHNGFIVCLLPNMAAGLVKPSDRAAAKAQTAADARLIAAAPDLLAVAQMMAAWDGTDDHLARIANAAESAIHKATTP